MVLTFAMSLMWNDYLYDLGNSGKLLNYIKNYLYSCQKCEKSQILSEIIFP